MPTTKRREKVGGTPLTVNRLVLKHHMIDQHVRHGSCYGHRRLRSSTGLRTHRASSSYNQGMSLQARPESTYINRNPQLLELCIHLVGLRRSLVRYYGYRRGGLDDPDSLPVGTGAWWRAMDRTNRGGNPGGSGSR